MFVSSPGFTLHIASHTFYALISLEIIIIVHIRICESNTQSPTKYAHAKFTVTRRFLCFAENTFSNASSVARAVCRQNAKISHNSLPYFFICLQRIWKYICHAAAAGCSQRNRTVSDSRESFRNIHLNVMFIPCVQSSPFGGKGRSFAVQIVLHVVWYWLLQNRNILLCRGLCGRRLFHCPLDSDRLFSQHSSGHLSWLTAIIFFGDCYYPINPPKEEIYRYVGT